MVANLGGTTPATASGGSFAQTLAAQGNSQEALAAGTGSFPPSPAPSSAGATGSATTAAATAALDSLAATTPVDTTSFGDDGAAASNLPPAGLTTSASTLDQLIQKLQSSAVAPGGAVTAAPTATTSAPAPATGTPGQRMLAAAQEAIGITESPAGSNDGPGLAIFRSAVAGSEAGQPWCATFASWAARQAGTPLGSAGQGIASVQGISDWAAQTKRLQPPSAMPSPGDLVLFGSHHIGVVESVNADGTLTTVEGNYRNSVQHVHRSPREATGYVKLG